MIFMKSMSVNTMRGPSRMIVRIQAVTQAGRRSDRITSRDTGRQSDRVTSRDTGR